jgi:hypothetical protein
MPQRTVNFRTDPELWQGLLDVKERDGISISEQLRRAIRAWLETKDMPVRPTKPTKPTATRRRTAR